MNCIACGARMKVRQVYQAGSTSKTARAECPECERVYTLVTFIVGEAEGRGQGAYALAKRLEKRKPPNLDL